ncbi:MAG: amidohydrolase [Oscillospiraceae bacterium]|nr:amidohydrolase [Oscillospiraceae bacterium]
MDKTHLYQTIEDKSKIFTDLSDRIWALAELSMEEIHSADAYIELLKELGFEITEQIAGIPTAFSGRFGSGKPVIGILGEFDALSGLSQVPCSAEKQALVQGGNGHGCGHNLLGAASLAAAYAIKEAICSDQLQGTVIFYGCPGEEGCAGKTFMAREGIFAELDAALCWHPGDVNEVTTGSCAACLQYEYSFRGLSAHAAGDPENGRSALDAAELMNVGVQFLREHMSKSASIHYSYSDPGGLSPNVVQPTAKLIYMVRERTVRQAKQLLERVHKIAQGAALMTETAVSWRQIDGTSNTLSNTVIEQVLSENLQQAPLPAYTSEEWCFAQQLKDTFHSTQLPGQRTEDDPKLQAYVRKQTQDGTKALNDFILPYDRSTAFNPGSTDVGDVSWLTPTAQFTAVTWVSGSPGHSWQNVSIGKSSIAHKGLLYAAKVLAGATADMMSNSKLLNEIRDEFSVAAADGYDCPVEYGYKDGSQI